jgi:hypothetical protein
VKHECPASEFEGTSCTWLPCAARAAIAAFETLRPGVRDHIHRVFVVGDCVVLHIRSSPGPNHYAGSIMEIVRLDMRRYGHVPTLDPDEVEQAARSFP